MKEPVLIDLPESFDTARLQVRVARAGDGAVHHEAVIESLAELRPWLGWCQEAPSLDECEAVCRRAYARFLLREDIMLLLFLRRTGELVGASGLHDIDWGFRRFEVGYWGRTRFAGAGLMTEGVRAIVEFARDELAARRIYLTTDARNVRSWRLAERVGFCREGTLIGDRPDLRGEPRDTLVYGFPL